MEIPRDPERELELKAREREEEMVTIRNINPRYGDSVTFTEETLELAIESMIAAIEACGYRVPHHDLFEGIDYEIVQE